MTGIKHHRLETTKQFLKFVRRVVANPDTGCWEWTGGKQQCGYGKIRHDKRVFLAHRVAYETWREMIPDHLVVDHLCRNRSCVRPDHMELVTDRENILRGMANAAKNARKEHCNRGHPLSGENLVCHDGNRHCRTCRNAKARMAAKKRRVQNCHR